MRRIDTVVGAFLSEDEGAAASEYAVSLSLIIVAITAAVLLFDVEDAFGALGGLVRSASGL